MDWQSVQPFFHWLSDHSTIAGIVVFLIAFTESLIVVGLIVPGIVLMFGVGTLVGAGALAFWDTIIIAFFGAVAGDAISFLIGKHYHERVMQVWPFKQHPEYFEKGERFFRKHGGKSILFGRFIGPVRPIIPAVAGMMGMSQSYFFFINVLSAAGWAPFYLMPGIVFGSSLALAAAVGTRLVVVLLSCIVLVLLASWLFKVFFRSTLPWFQNHFVVWYENAVISKRLLRLIFDESVVLDRGAFLVSTASVLLTIFVLGLITSFWEPRIDTVVREFFTYIQISYFTAFYDFVISFIEWGTLVFILINMALLSVYYGQNTFVMRYLGAISAACGVLFAVFLLKYFISGDSVFLVGELAEQVRIVLIAAYTLLVIRIFDYWFEDTARLFVAPIVMIFGLVISTGLLYFSFISFSGLVMGVSAASLILLLVIWGVEYKLKQSFVNAFSISSLSIIVLFSALSIEEYQFQEQPTTTTKRVDMQNWLDSNWQDLESYRNGLLFDEASRFNAQWRGSKESIQQWLLNNGWRSADVNLKGLLMWLSADAELRNLANIPASHYGRRQAFAMEKYFGEEQSQRYLLRFFKQQSIAINDEPVWLVTITLDTLGEPKYWLANIDYQQNDRIAAEVAGQLSSPWQVERIEREEIQNRKNNDLLLIYKQEENEK